jgi:hypothetical protein
MIMGLFRKLFYDHSGMLINAGDARIYRDSYCCGNGKTQYFMEDPVYIVLDETLTSYMVRHHSLSSGITGFFKKIDVAEL